MVEKIKALIFQCQIGQSISIGADIQVILLGHFNEITHIGVEAPTEIKITQKEFENREPYDHK